MPSITTWSRLEPQTPGEDVATGYAARVHDPLWLLARQWQVGEFQGEDAGTPIVARWRARVAPMTRYVAGPIPTNTQLDAGPFDASLPLETQVERQPLTQSRPWQDWTGCGSPSRAGTTSSGCFGCRPRRETTPAHSSRRTPCRS